LPGSDDEKLSLPGIFGFIAFAEWFAIKKN
jgi:hypothetical protein